VSNRLLYVLVIGIALALVLVVANLVGISPVLFVVLLFWPLVIAAVLVGVYWTIRLAIRHESRRLGIAGVHGGPAAGTDAERAEAG
jgi:ABC-type sugar transport system permease subunit